MASERRAPDSPFASPDRRASAAARRRAVRRRRLTAVSLLVISLALLLSIGWLGQGTDRRSAGAKIKSGSRPARLAPPAHFDITRLRFQLPAPLQDAAASSLGSERVVLLGGLDATDTSIATVSVVDRQGVTAGAPLPEAQHDAQAVPLGARVYVFGGGQFASYSHILSYDPETGAVAAAGSLPAATSDAGVAAIAGTAYVVGGYDGRQALDTIVAWRPGEAAGVVARLPYGLRYAAVAASAGRLVIAGGSREEAASAAILSFDPATRRVRELGQLPDPVTHAAAAALGSYVYVLGGRGTAAGTQTAAIVAIDPYTGRSVNVGQLPAPLSDATAIALGDAVWLAGGLGASDQPVASVLQLAPAGP